MRSALVLRSPSQGTGWQETWTLSGKDDRILRDCLDQLDAYRVEAPTERHDPDRHTFLIDAEDRWRAAMILRAPEPSLERQPLYQAPAEGAWSREGAIRLAELLPGALDEIRHAIRARFGASQE